MERPMIKTGHQPTLRPDGAIWIGPAIYGLASELIDHSGLVWPLCGLLDGTRTHAEITSAMRREHGAGDEEVQQILDLMLSRGWLIDAASTLPPELSASDVIRHKRTLEFLCDIDESPRPNPYTLLTKLRDSSIVVLGVGGVGSAVSSSLVATGIGRIHLLDFDTVELSNLNRQLLFTEGDVGRPKTEVVAERLRALDSGAVVSTEHARITGPDVIARAIEGADLVFSCADRPYEVHDWVNAACFAARTPWMISSYTQSMVATATLIPGTTGCYTCLSAPLRAKKRALGEQAAAIDYGDFHPVIAASAQIAGNQLALEGIRFLLGMPVQTAGLEVYRNLLDFTHFYTQPAEPLPDCPVGCGRMLGASGRAAEGAAPPAVVAGMV